MNISSADFDELVFFAYDIAQGMSSCMRENNWVSENYLTWETQGFEALRNFLLEDIDETHLEVRKKALSATLQHAQAQLRLFTNFYSKMGQDRPEREREFDATSKLVNVGYFLNTSKNMEKGLLKALEKSVVAQTKRRPKV